VQLLSLVLDLPSMIIPSCLHLTLIVAAVPSEEGEKLIQLAGYLRGIERMGSSSHIKLLCA